VGWCRRRQGRCALPDAFPYAGAGRGPGGVACLSTSPGPSQLDPGLRRGTVVRGRCATVSAGHAWRCGSRGARRVRPHVPLRTCRGSNLRGARACVRFVPYPVPRRRPGSSCGDVAGYAAPSRPPSQLDPGLRRGTFAKVRFAGLGRVLWRWRDGSLLLPAPSAAGRLSATVGRVGARAGRALV
jgi:hypothetical protein